MSKEDGKNSLNSSARLIFDCLVAKIVVLLSTCEETKNQIFNGFYLRALFWILRPGPDSKDRRTKFEIDETIPEVNLWPKSISLKALELNIFDSNSLAEKERK